MDKCKKQPDIDITASSDCGRRNGLDLIRRQNLMEQLNELCDKQCPYNEPTKAIGACCASCVIDDVIEMVQQLPSAEPERKTGKWIQHPIYEGSDHYYYACSECDYRSWSKDNFCSVCGAKMKEEEVSNGSD